MRGLFFIILFLPFSVLAQSDTTKCDDLVFYHDEPTGNVYISSEATITLNEATTSLFIVPTIVTGNSDSLCFRLITQDYTRRGEDTANIDKEMLIGGTIRFLFSDGTKYDIDNFREEIHRNEHGYFGVWYELSIGGTDLNYALNYFTNKKLEAIRFKAYGVKRAFHMANGGSDLMNSAMNCLSRHLKK